ncbi:unannotated protein [freshwater metagenome]|jgi:hypothetical protein|uniref:Unannotated protein n=1 Tax=freshwater metagenome TaxID=449393 RepID=A0A6J6W512_9ZZZZ|nr:hypothetical protein [Actinomycetota bacterium]MSW75471.1 hypothetical protein [Actinomycetota bacterium]MSY30564.1 hypothetical protein [Actinomycetota bacterium]
MTKTIEVPEAQSPSQSDTCRPRLKVGVRVLTKAHSLYVGNAHFGIELESSHAREIVNHLKGTMTVIEISATLGISADHIQEIVTQLDTAHLIDTHLSKLEILSRFHSQSKSEIAQQNNLTFDGAHQQIQSKLTPELTFTTWLRDVRDGGVSHIGSRRDINLEIFGDNRIATLLFGIMLASGVSHTTLHSSRHMIETQDLCAGFFRASDIGLSLDTRADELSRELSLFPLPQKLKKSEEILPTREIRVVLGKIPADQLQEWMSKGITHLIIEDPDGASINIGPLVIPGSGPCLRCVRIAREENDVMWREIEWQRAFAQTLETPVAVAHSVAGTVALELLRFIDTGACDLINSMTHINFHSPCNTEHTEYSQHPACGCNW